MALYFLFESAVGYALFEKIEFDEVNANQTQIQKAITNLESFSKMIRMKAFTQFTNAEKALENALQLSESKITDDLKNFLELNLPAKKEKMCLSSHG